MCTLSCKTFRIYIIVYSWEFLTDPYDAMRYVVIADTTKWLIFFFRISNFCSWLEICCMCLSLWMWISMETGDRSMNFDGIDKHEYASILWIAMDMALKAMCDKTEFKLTSSWLKFVLQILFGCFATSLKVPCHQMDFRGQLCWNLKLNLSMAAVYFYWFILKTTWKVAKPKPIDKLSF